MQLLLSSSEKNFVLESLENASTKDDVRNLMQTYGYDNVAPLWNEISPAQQAALMLVRNFAQSQIIHGLDDESTGT